MKRRIISERESRLRFFPNNLCHGLSLLSKTLAALDGHPQSHRVSTLLQVRANCCEGDSKTIGNTPLTLSTAALSRHGDRFTIFERSWGEKGEDGRDFRSAQRNERIDPRFITHLPISFHSKRVEKEDFFLKYFFLPSSN